MSSVIAGIDLGGSSVKIALAQSDGKLICSEQIPTDAHLGPSDVMDRIASTIIRLADEQSVVVASIGMGVPGLVDIGNGMTKFLPNLQGQWRDIPVAKMLREKLSCDVNIANDARTATLGELQFGHGAQRQDLTMAFFTLGTGVGGGVAIDGKLRLGPFGAAGELGHQTILLDGPRCGCGNRGCLETLASGPAIASEGIRLMNMGLAPQLHALVDGDASRVTVYEMVQVADQEETIREALATAARYIGIAAANVVTILHPDLIVLGGGVAEIGDLLINTVKQVIADRVGMFPADNVQVKKSKLDVQAGVMGAIALGMRNAISHPEDSFNQK